MQLGKPPKLRDVRGIPPLIPPEMSLAKEMMRETRQNWKLEGRRDQKAEEDSK